VKADRLDELVESLLYEGYFLFPYTATSEKNITPTPFGIVYPPAYAAGSSVTFDRLALDCALAAGDGAEEAEIELTLRFLQSSGPRHQASDRTVSVGPVHVGAGLDAPAVSEFEFAPLAGRVTLAAESVKGGGARVAAQVENLTEMETANVLRAEALELSLLSTHVVLRTSAGRFVSPLEHSGDNFNTFPVLATDEDDAILGAAIVLPDHPQIAPESRGNLFDNTEIEEALLLHVQTLSDDERDAIAEQDPKVREMIARAEAATPEDVMALHGRLELKDPPPAPSGPPNFPGETQVTVDGRTFRREGKVVLRPGAQGDPFDMMVDGKVATIERIYYDTEDKLYLAVTVDDDPGQDLLRDSGRYLFFFPDEVEVIEG